MRTKHVHTLLLLIMAGFFGVSCSSNTAAVEETDELLLVPKEYDSKGKVVNSKKVSPYSCLISTLQSEEEEHNYWNQSFWVRIPKALLNKEQEEETVLEVFVYGDRDAGQKSGSFGEYGNVVRVAQCEIPDSDKVRDRLNKQFRKFGKKSWLDGKQKTNGENASGDIRQKSDWEWVCTRYFITIVCSSTSCVITEVRCISWDLEYSGPSGGGGGGGFPSDDPGECDPSGTEPCFDDGGGSVPPPPSPDPCDEQNPPVWCNCTATNDPVLDDTGIKEEIYNLWSDSNGDAGNPGDRVEQGMWITKNPATGEYGAARFGAGFSNFTECGFSWANFQMPANTVGWVHTHPFEINETMYSCHKYVSPALIDMLIQSPNGASIYNYQGTPSTDDINFINTVEAQAGINLKSYLVDQDGITRFDENSSTNEIGNSPRHTRSCY